MHRRANRPLSAGVCRDAHLLFSLRSLTASDAFFFPYMSSKPPADVDLQYLLLAVVPSANSSGGTGLLLRSSLSGGVGPSPTRGPKMAVNAILILRKGEERRGEGEGGEGRQ